MKVSLNAIKQQGYPELFEIPIDELVDKINGQLGALEEEPFNLGDLYNGIVVAKVVACEKHSNADKLNVCLIDDGGVANDSVPRNDEGLIQVVCGAPNVKAGMTVAWLPPGTTVPASVGKEPFVLEAREIRGVVSNGMLASASELAISEDHSGILEIKEEETDISLMKPGTPFKQLYGLDDYILNIENKMFTHRPDLFGHLGIARELAGIQHKGFKSPSWYNTGVLINPASQELPIKFQNELPGEVPRFVLVPISGVQVKASPVWLQTWLSRLGLRSINNIVDLTNYFMMLTGQPLHAYDYDKVKALSGDEASIIVRNPKPGEKIQLLNGKEIEPRPEAIMIATDQKLIGAAGIMGGAETEVDENTKSIILEVGTFDMYSVRRTSMAHGLFTDAVTRFNKGQSPLQNMAFAAKAVAEITALAGGQVVGQVIDDNHLDQSAVQRQSLHVPITLPASFINERLGLELSSDEIKVLLQNVEFNVTEDSGNLTIQAPFWRTDIELREDLVEEVGRLYGYDHLPLTLPVRDLTPTRRDPMFDLKANIREVLSTAGANELLTYSFVHSGLFTKVGQDENLAFQISNALSPDLQYYRLSLTPSLLEKVHPNIKAGYDNFALFEIGRTHVIGQNDAHEPEVPKEIDSVGFVYASKRALPGAPFYQAKKYFKYLLTEFKAAGLVKLAPFDENSIAANPWLIQATKPFEAQRSAIVQSDDGKVWGVVGEYKASVRRTLKLPAYSAGFEFDPLLLNQVSKITNYATLPKFPSLTQDITLRVPTGLSHRELVDLVWEESIQAKPVNSKLSWSTTDIYQKQDRPDYKQVTLRLNIASYDRTLTDGEVSRLLDQVASAAASRVQAERV